MTVSTDLIINGEWRKPGSGDYDDVINPARPEEVVGRSASATTEDTRAAIAAAAAAQPEWWRKGWAERAESLRRIAEVVSKGTEERAEILTRENGKLLKESMLEMTRLGDRFIYTAGLAEQLANDQVFDAPPHHTTITYQPFGVTVLIVPYNWPLSILGAKLPQALLAGNTVVIKPPPTAPLAMVKTLGLMAEVLPSGVLNVVTGSIESVGTELIENPRVRKIDFTGSVAAGRQIMAQASKTLKDVTLELGGNDPGILLDDVEVDQEVLQRLTMGAFLTAGQVCMALKRLYVHRSIYDQVVDGMVGILENSVVGDGLAPDSTMGAVNNRQQLDKVRGMVQEAEEAGADVLRLGKPRDEAEFEIGFFHLPTLVTGVSDGHRVVDEEQFGPVLPIMPFDDEDEAVAMANDSEYGLCSSVWSSDLERAKDVARRLEAGYTYINIHGPMGQDNRAPFGGVKQSGINRQLGIQGVYAFLEPHSISVPGQ